MKIVFKFYFEGTMKAVESREFDKMSITGYQLRKIVEAVAKEIECFYDMADVFVKYRGNTTMVCFKNSDTKGLYLEDVVI